MSDQAPPPGSIHCPACGVAVAPGYPRCPKCHAPLPAAPAASPAARARVGRELYAGGTSVGGDAAGGGLPWLWIGIGGAAVLAVVLILVLRGGDDAPAPAADVPPPVPEETGGAAAAGPEDPAADVPPLQAEPAGPDLSSGVRLLDTALKERRLWATVEVDATDPTVIDLRSGLCADAGVREVITGAAEELAALGVSAVRCYERHGALAFEQPL